MTLTHLNAKTNKNKFLRNREKIVKLYNQSNDFHYENPKLDYECLTQPELIHAFINKKVLGGVLVEQLVGNSEFALITFAAIEESQRGKGICTELINFATETLQKSGVKIVGVQVNDFDSRDFWISKGFTEEVPHQNITVLLKPSV